MLQWVAVEIFSNLKLLIDKQVSLLSPLTPLLFSGLFRLPAPTLYLSRPNLPTLAIGRRRPLQIFQQPARTDVFDHLPKLAKIFALVQPVNENHSYHLPKKPFVLLRLDLLLKDSPLDSGNPKAIIYPPG